MSEPPISAESAETLDLLLRYALRGLRVVPLNGLDGAGNCECQQWRDKKKVGPGPTPGKHPRLRKWQELATTDATIIRKWHKSYPRANWGIATGRGVFVLDNDPRHGGDDSLAVLVSRHGPLDDTLQALTGGGGSHRYYSVPAGVIIPNDVAVMPGLDVRGDGGQVVVPPSLHKSGNRYQWDGLAGFYAAIIPAPAWLLNLLGVGSEKKRGKAAVIPETIRDGEKHTMCVSLAGSMRRRGCTSEEIYVALLKLSERFESRVPPENLRAIAEDIEVRYAPATTDPNSTGTRNLVDFPFTDTGNAERLVAAHGNDLRFCADMKKWGTWDGRRWVFQDSRRVKALAKRTMRLMYAHAADIEDKELREAAEKHARKSESSVAINAMLSCAEYEDGIPVAPDELDTDPYSLNFQNGTVDLRTGALRPHRQEDLITKLIHHEYEPDAACPRWLAFLDQVMGGGPDASESELDRAQRLMDYVQRALGYSLTGCTIEKAVFIPFGPPDTGKSTMLSTIRNIAKEYSALLQVDTLMTRQESNNTQADLADLRGARFVQTSETEEGQRLAQGKLKRISQGMGEIKATKKFENPITFPETHKLWIDTNKKPTIRDAEDRATFNRLHPIPFIAKITKIDRDMPAKLLRETLGILAWLVEGAIRWHESGLQRPPEVEAARNQWRVEMDKIGRFIEECCNIADGLKCPARALYAAYKTWAEASGEKEIMNSTLFGIKISDRDGITKGHSRLGTLYSGIGLRGEPTEEEALP